jgi:hypothetical protein
VVTFTNSGIVFVPGAAKYGTDRPEPYNSVVNSGTNTAASQLVRTLMFENSGCFVANRAIAQIDAVSARIEGAPIVIQTNIFPQVAFTNFTFVTNGFVTNIFYSSFGAKVQSYSDLQIKAGDLSVSNSLLAAGSFNTSFLIPGRLVLDVTNTLVDAGPEARNSWSCTAGFDVRRLPTTSSLLGTWLSTAVGVNRQETHYWPAQDLLAVADGFVNNLALGKLSINISTRNSRAVFRSANGRGAMYVDYVELLNGATNFNSSIFIDTNMTIYFANANVPASKLDGAAGGRFVWVSSFTGPLSTTNITYPSGNTYSFNIALATSSNIDSDNDGCVNADDPTPFPVPGENTQDCLLQARGFAPASVGTTADLRLSVALDDSRPPQAKLSWQPRAHTTSTIEFKDDWTTREWQVLTNIVSGDAPRPVTIHDSITRDGHMRVYRLRVSPAPSR